MGIKSFFKKIGGGIKKAFNWVKDKVAPVFNKVWKVASPIVKVGASLIPGVGPAIAGGIGMAEKIVPMAGKIANGIINHSTNGETPQPKPPPPMSAREGQFWGKVINNWGSSQYTKPDPVKDLYNQKYAAELAARQHP
jgi:hypothetical protein